MPNLEHSAVYDFANWGWSLKNVTKTHGRWTPWKAALDAYEKRREQCL